MDMDGVVLVATYVVGAVIAALVAGRVMDTDDDDAELAPLAVGMVAVIWPVIVVIAVPFLIIGGIGAGAIGFWRRRGKA